jgi:Casein kinase substrate phosphoprotein PP28
MFREALEAAAAKERFWKLQEAGKTDQARADLARLAIIRKEREEKAKQRQVSRHYMAYAYNRPKQKQR